MKNARRVITAVSLTVVATITVSGAATATPTARTSDLSASQLVALSLASARGAGWCTNVSHGSAVGYTFGATTQSGPDVARQSIHLNTAVGDALLVRGHLYIKESARLLAAQFAAADARWANRWIAVPSTSPVFTSVASGMLFTSMLRQVRPAGTLRRSPVGHLHGVAVIAVSGAANSQLGLSRGVETLFVSATAPFLPVELLAGGRSQGVPTSLTVDFSQWGHHFSVAAPASATALSSTTLH